MTYQVSYLSPAGNCAKLAEALADILEDVCVVDLTCDDEISGDIHLIGFELNKTDLKTIPYEIMALLDGLDGMTVLLFVTCPFQPDQKMKQQMEWAILPFLPEECDYRGLFLCAGQPSDVFLTTIRTVANRQPEDKNARAMLQSCEAAVGHPDDNDLMQACLFASKALKLE